MPRIDSEKFYSAAIQQHGVTPQGVNWISQHTQEIRFKILLHMLPKTISSLVDAGCGFGDLYGYILNNNINIESYVGIDSHMQMCEIAKKNTQQHILHANILHDPLPLADYYLCSGAMNILHDFEMQLFVKRCFENVKKAFVFNVLHGDKHNATYNYVTKKDIHSLADALKVTRVQIHEGYMKNDITVGFFK